jgi:hypothetical protein
MAAVCLRVWAVTCLDRIEGQDSPALEACRARRCSMGIAAEGPAGPGREQRLGRRALPFGEPGSQHGDGRLHQWCSPLLAALADAVDVRAGAEHEVCQGKAGQLGYAQPGLDGEEDHGVIAPPGPGRLVAGGQQGVDLVLGEVGDEVALEAFGRDGEHALDRRGVLRVAQGGVAEQRVDGGEAVVASADAVVAVAFEVVQERCNGRGVEVADVELAGLLVGAVDGEAEQESEGVPIGGDRVAAGAALAEEPVGEERLQGGGEHCHRGAPNRPSRRAAASSMSSGAADRYQ